MFHLLPSSNHLPCTCCVVSFILRIALVSKGSGLFFASKKVTRLPKDYYRGTTAKAYIDRQK
jgi:hypothetical protein